MRLLPAAILLLNAWNLTIASKFMPRTDFSKKEVSKIARSFVYRENVKNAIQNKAFSTETVSIKPFQDQLIFVSSLPLIGRENLLSQQIIQGINCAFLAENENGGVKGKKLHLLTINDYGIPAMTMKNINRMANKKNRRVIFGAVGEPCFMSLMPYIRDGDALMLFPYAFNKTSQNGVLRNVFHGMVDKELQIDEVVKFALHAKKARRIAIFAASDEEGDYLERYCSVWLQESKRAPVSICKYHPDQNNILDEVQALIKSKPDCIICLGNFMANSILINHAIKNKLVKTSFIGTDEMFFTAKILEDYSDKIHYCSFVPSLKEFYSFDISKEYMQRLNKFYPKEIPTPLGLSYYIHAKLIISVLKKTEHDLCQDNLATILQRGIESCRAFDLGGILADFAYHSRQTYPLDPQVVTID